MQPDLGYLIGQQGVVWESKMELEKMESERVWVTELAKGERYKLGLISRV